MQTKNQRNRNRQKQSENDEISNKKGAYEHYTNSLKLFMCQYIKYKITSRFKLFKTQIHPVSIQMVCNN